MLSEEQQALVDVRDGRVVAIAGPGAGKTHAVTERTRKLVRSGVDPATIVALTFTTRAAAEYENRLGGLRLGYCGTFHSFARFLIVNALLPTDIGENFTILDPHDREDLLRGLCKELNTKCTASSVKKWLDARHAMGLLGPPEAVDRRSEDGVRVIQAYQDLKKELNAEDFNGLIETVVRTLGADPLVCDGLRNRYRHYTVDEAQDIDEMQARMLYLLCDPVAATPTSDRSLVLIGDVSQCVYRWRGAQTGVILGASASAHYDITLANNYRSLPDIVCALNEIRKHDMAAGSWSDIATRAPCSAIGVEIHGYDAAEKQDKAIVSEIAIGVNRCMEYSDFAVLCRLNKNLPTIADALHARDIPYQLLGEQQDAVSRSGARDCVAAMRLALNPADDYSFDRLARRIHPEPEGFMIEVRKESARIGLPHFFSYLSLCSTDNNAFDKLTARIATLAGPHNSGNPLRWPAKAVLVCDEIAWAHDDRTDTRHLARHVVGMIGLIRNFEQQTSIRGRATLRHFLWWALFGRGSNEYDPNENVVTLATIHMAKGLEWHTVFMPWLNEGTLPSRMSHDDKSMLDELRVFYVGASRASDRLLLSHVHGRPPSRFLDYV